MNKIVLKEIKEVYVNEQNIDYRRCWLHWFSIVTELINKGLVTVVDLLKYNKVH